MPTYYCNLGGSLQDTLHVDSLPTVGGMNHQAQSADELVTIIERTGAAQVMFSFAWMPRRAVSVDSTRLARHMTQLFSAPKPTPYTPVLVAVNDDFNPADIIDNR